MEFRIGVNSGDVMVEGEQIYGDGVNVAARLESLADPGGICISGTVYDHVRDKLALACEDRGEQAVKNIARPVRVWRVLLDEATPSRGEMRRRTRRYWRGGVLPLAGIAIIAATFVLVQHLSLRQQPTHASIPAPLEQLRNGDTIILWKLDRLARCTRDLLETMKTMLEAGARFQSLSEPWANTTSHAGKLIMAVFARIAEFDRDLIPERASAGRLAARRRGIHFGRPRKLNPEQTNLVRRLINEGKSVREIADTFNVHTATIYSALSDGGLINYVLIMLRVARRDERRMLIVRHAAETNTALSRLQPAPGRLRHDLKDGTTLADETIATRVGQYAVFEMR